ncbi:MAG: PIG-L family deacetylase [Lentisphaeria bacterium]|jgi:LmbE family N-acetylglucosaminyl deacetylase
MIFTKPDAEVFVPDGLAPEPALARTTHLAIMAHQDDLEIAAYHGICACFGRPDLWFTGVVATDGAGSARTGPYANRTDAEMRLIRQREQRKAASIGEYGALIQLMHPSAEVKDPANQGVVADLGQILEATRPQVVYLHNPADKHDTHVATLLRALVALRKLPRGQHPAKVYGCEVWRSLDWLLDADKQGLPVSGRANLAAALLGVFDSQISGGKRYDLATTGRRLANATFFESHGCDRETALSWAVDLTPLVHDATLSTAEYLLGLIERFRQDVATRIRKFGGD